VKIQVAFIALGTMMGFIACGGGGSSSTGVPEEQKTTLKKTDQNISFTKYDDGFYQIGQTRNYQRENEIVTDMVTGLEWQDTNETGNLETDFDWAEAQSYCADLVLNKKDDWRLPSARELKSLVIYNKAYPAMTDALNHLSWDFMEGYNDNYWSSTLDTSDSTFAWIVSSYYGSDLIYPIYNWAKVRCVRGESNTTFSYERDEELGIVTDLKTNLFWQDDYRDNNNSVKKASFSDALNYCEALTLGNREDWRLPNITELYSLVDKTKQYPSTDAIFQKIVASYYWSSTAEMQELDYQDDNPSFKWGVGFDFGDDGTWFDAETGEHYVRCVRGGK